MSHEARQVPSWLIFDVGQKMSPEYRDIFENGVLRILERPTPELESFVVSLGLPSIRCVGCAPRTWCEPKLCFVNVDRQVAQKGGEMVVGWIWQELAGVSLTGDAHAIWRSNDGKLRDITPHDGAPRRVAFCEDPRVLAKRGYTAPPKKIVSKDERAIKVEMYASALARMIEAKFERIGGEMLIDSGEAHRMALEIGLPDDVSHMIFQAKIARFPRLS
jgi:hypothetical protein